MTALNVRIEDLKPMRIASVRVTSATPEMDAWRKLRTWANSKDLLSDLERHPVFGYTIQPPKENEKEYGYEFWIAIGPETEVGGDVQEQAFAGGLYAVTTQHGPPTPEVWKGLWDWVQASPYRWRKTHELEKPRNPLAPENELIFDLYLPIETEGENKEKTKGSGVNAIRIVRNSAPPRALGRLAREAASCEDGVVQRHLSQEATDGCRFDSCSAAA